MHMYVWDSFSLRCALLLGWLTNNMTARGTEEGGDTRPLNAGFGVPIFLFRSRIQDPRAKIPGGLLKATLDPPPPRARIRTYGGWFQMPYLDPDPRSTKKVQDFLRTLGVNLEFMKDPS